MSELMDRAVIGMPYEMAMEGEVARRQFYSRAQSLLAEVQVLRDQVAALQSAESSYQSGYDDGRRMGAKHRQSEVEQLTHEVEELREKHDKEWRRAGIAEANLQQALHGKAPTVRDRLELTEDLKNILGRPNFTCTHLAGALRQMDYVIERKSEAEQAACLHWMLNHYLAHGADWKVHAEAELKAAAAAQEGE